MLVVTFGAVLAFAVDWSIGGTGLKDIGWMLMIAGLVAVILLSALWKRRLEAEAATSLRQRRQAADVPSTIDPTPPPSAMTTVPPSPETVTPKTPLPTTAPKHVTALRASAPAGPAASAAPPAPVDTPVPRRPQGS